MRVIVCCAVAEFDFQIVKKYKCDLDLDWYGSQLLSFGSESNKKDICIYTYMFIYIWRASKKAGVGSST